MLISYVAVPRHQSNMHSTLHDDARSQLSKISRIDIRNIETSEHTLFGLVQDLGEAVDRDHHDNFFWKQDESNTRIMLVWPPYDITNIAGCSEIESLRADELLFPSLDIAEHLCWVAGHPRAMLHWVSTLHHSMAVTDPHPGFHRANASNRRISETASMVWWAQRINLKVYGVL